MSNPSMGASPGRLASAVGGGGGGASGIPAAAPGRGLIHRASARHSASGSIGLEMKSCMPAFMQRSRSTCMALAVMARMGMASS